MGFLFPVRINTTTVELNSFLIMSPFDANFKFSSWALNISRTHPRIQRNLIWLLNFIVRHSLFTLSFIAIVYNIKLNLKNSDFDDACRNGTLGIVYVVITFMHFLMTWKQSVMLKIISFMEEDFNRAEFYSIEDQEIIAKYVKAGNHVCRQWFIVCGGGVLLFPLKAFLSIIYYWGIDQPRLVSIIELIYPNAIEMHKENIYVYVVINAVLAFYDWYAGLMYLAFVPLCPVFMIHVCGQLELVEKKIERLFSGSLDEAEENLKEIVQRLQYIYRFAYQILSGFQVIYEFILRGSTLLLPLTLFEIIEALHRGDLPLEFISFIVGGFLISSSPCYYSDLMMEKSERVRTAMYCSGWESVLDRRIRSTIKIIMIRTLRPVAIQTLFRTVCLETLADMLRQSYALFNLMNSTWK